MLVWRSDRIERVWGTLVIILDAEQDGMQKENAKVRSQNAEVKKAECRSKKSECRIKNEKTYGQDLIAVRFLDFCILTSYF